MKSPGKLTQCSLFKMLRYVLKSFDNFKSFEAGLLNIDKIEAMFFLSYKKIAAKALKVDSYEI